MPAWKLTIEYDGTRYRGWQQQKNGRTIAGELTAVAREIFSSNVELTGSGRTDAGVHALGQVVMLKADKAHDASDLLYALNRGLPADINVLNVEHAKQSFHPRHDALSRYYIYQISTRRSAFAKRYVWWVRDRLNFDEMSVASRSILGRHDFKEFCEKLEDERSTIVAVSHVEMVRDGDLILLRVGASHFLWKMVRRLVGALVEVGRGSLSVGDFKAFLRPHQPPLQGFDIAAHTAPPSGLFLERVVYDKSTQLPGLTAAFPVRR
jgi:tRNA pseudouridine38-40 synthase